VIAGNFLIASSMLSDKQVLPGIAIN